MVQSCLGVLSMAGFSSTTSTNFQFPVSISIVHTIAVFCFKKRENASKNREKREVQTCSKHEPLRYKILAPIWSKTKPRKVNMAGPNMPKTWTSREERRISSNKPKTRAEIKEESDSNKLKTWVTKKRRMLQDFRFQAFKILFSVFCKFLSMCNCLYALDPQLDCLILGWLFLNFCCRM